jgi:pyruvate formate lyase activating enzyme
MEAQYYEKMGSQVVRCFLCPHRCVIQPGRRGLCRIRFNSGGTLIAESFGLYSAIHFDPVEKKPLYHFYPGSEILSLGSVGCNMRCYWCQNCEISQSGIGEDVRLNHADPEKIIELAVTHNNNIGIAYTYNEPSISIENILDVAQKVRQKGMKNVMVTNGFIGEKPLEALIELIDSMNIDLKAFDNSTYRKYTGSGLEPVLTTIKKVVMAGLHVELTHLVVTGINDDTDQFRAMTDWIANECGKNTVLHISRYFPRYKMDNPPTSAAKLTEFAEIASEKLNYVYLGNLASDRFNNTLCPECHAEIITRNGDTSKITGSISQGKCSNCNTKIFVND